MFSNGNILMIKDQNTAESRYLYSPGPQMGCFLLLRSYSLRNECSALSVVLGSFSPLHGSQTAIFLSYPFPTEA